MALAAALWVLLDPGTRPDRRTTSERNGVVHTGGAKGGSGVSARGTQDAGQRLFGRVTDIEGGPVGEGTVTFECAATGRPLPGASSLDEQGRFEGYGCPGLVCVQLHHPSLIQSEVWLIETGVESELYAKSKPQLFGTVTAGGEGLAGVRIRVDEADEDPTSMPAFAQRSTSTDADGDFRLPRVALPPCDPCAQERGQCELGESRKDVLYRGPLTLLASARGFTTGVRHFDEMPAGRIELELYRPTRMTMGRIVGADGATFPRADLVFRSEDRPHESHRAPLREGEFEVAELASGNYLLRVLQDGKELLSLPGVNAGLRLDLRSEFDARGVTLRVRVVGGGGLALPGVRVEGGPFARGSETDEAGELAIEDVLAGRYRARLWVQGGTPKQVSLELSADAIAAAKTSILGEIEVEFTYEPTQSARE